MGTWVKGSFLIRGPRAVCRVLTASGTLGFAGAQDEDGGEAKPMHGDGSVHAPGRPMLLVVSSASPCLRLQDVGVGKRGFVQPPPGQSWPHGDTGGYPHSVGSGTRQLH